MPSLEFLQTAVERHVLLGVRRTPEEKRRVHKHLNAARLVMTLLMVLSVLIRCGEKFKSIISSIILALVKFLAAKL